MNITKEKNRILIDGKKVSNFTLSKISENQFELNNGYYKAICKIEKRNLHHFKLRTQSLGNYMFYGNTKQLNKILDSLIIEKKVVSKKNTKTPKALVFSGGQATGKTYISSGIANFFPDKTLWLFRKNYDFRNTKKFDLYDLVIIDECISLNDIISLEKTRDKHPSTNFIFCIQKNIKLLDSSKYHLVECKFKH